ncbi:hypothetical protein EDC02_3127 [Micromonospora sp. Llam0]|nr:hypothetical protein EDC02_3127 [Micromonospora sp. Llam0]
MSSVALKSVGAARPGTFVADSSRFLIREYLADRGGALTELELFLTPLTGDRAAYAVAVRPGPWVNGRRAGTTGDPDAGRVSVRLAAA